MTTDHLTFIRKLCERAAIMEYDGELSRERAEMMVMEATWKKQA